MVVLALGLAAVGILLAMQQARSHADRLMARSEAEAGLIVEQAHSRFDREVANVLRGVVLIINSGADQPLTIPERFPSWVDGLLSWDEDGAHLLAPVSSTPDPRPEALHRRLSMDTVPKQVNRFEPTIVYDTSDDSSLLFACLQTTDPRGRHVVAAVSIDREQLRHDLIDPLLSSHPSLELVYGDQDSDRRWSQPLFRALLPWSINPTEAYVEEQKRALLTQTLLTLGPTMLALAVLLASIWVLGRVVQRDIALAEMKSNFVADVSHELKTPLALIHMFGETLQSGRITSEEKRKEYYDIITRESTRLTNLIENILDFSRIEAGRKTYILEPVAIGEVVRETYNTYRAQLEHHGFEHHLSVAPNLPIVPADRDAVAQAIINLITNAIKYSGEERYLALDVATDTRRNRSGVLISVHDRGFGIRPEDRARLFEGFFRSADGRVREKGGAGLGLSLVKHIVDAHGGSLDVESRLVKGSTFRIFLPSEEPGTVPEIETSTSVASAVVDQGDQM